MCAKYHQSDPLASASFKGLQRFILASRREASGSFEDYERELHRRIQASGSGKAICPLDLRAGIVEGCWSPLAARVMAQAVAISTPESRAAFEECRVWIRESSDGAQRVLRSLRYRRGRSRGTTRAAIDDEIRYIEKRTTLMRYKDLLDEKLPVGSGVVEAACKTLVSERLKRSGMSWREPGLQAIVTFQSLLHSDRWDRAWQIWPTNTSRTWWLRERRIRRAPMFDFMRGNK